MAAPRDFGIALDLEGGTGPILANFKYGDVLEFYKIDRTFRVRSPESVDPRRTNPHALFVVTSTSEVGAGNPIVARVLLQACELMGQALFSEQSKEIDESAVLLSLHECKELLLECDRIAERTSSAIGAVLSALQKDGLNYRNVGRAINPLPQVANLESEATSFLINAKRAIRLVCRLPSQFLDVKDGDTHFDGLGKTLTRALGVDDPIVKYAASNADAVRYVTELRNFQEHPTKSKYTAIRNFEVLPDNAIAPPVWFVSGDPPALIREEMRSCVEFLVDLAEGIFLLLLRRSLHPGFPFVFQRLDASTIRRDVPIRYRLGLASSVGEEDPEQ